MQQNSTKEIDLTTGSRSDKLDPVMPVNRTNVTGACIPNCKGWNHEY